MLIWQNIQRNIYNIASLRWAGSHRRPRWTVMVLKKNYPTWASSFQGRKTPPALWTKASPILKIECFKSLFIFNLTIFSNTARQLFGERRWRRSDSISTHRCRENSCLHSPFLLLASVSFFLPRDVASLPPLFIKLYHHQHPLPLRLGTACRRRCGTSWSWWRRGSNSLQRKRRRRRRIFTNIINTRNS